MILVKIIQVLKDQKNIPFFSFLIGMGLIVMLFHKPYVTKNTLSMPLTEIQKQIVKVDNKCFKYIAEDVQC
jgi:hypothetical protein